MNNEPIVPVRTSLPKGTMPVGVKIATKKGNPIRCYECGELKMMVEFERTDRGLDTMCLTCRLKENDNG